MAKEQGAEHVSTKHTLMALINDAVQDKENSRVAKVLEAVDLDLVTLRDVPYRALQKDESNPVVRA